MLKFDLLFVNSKIGPLLQSGLCFADETPILERRVHVPTVRILPPVHDGRGPSQFRS